MTKILERYASAVHATSLTSDPDTYMSNTDVLGAMGLASKQYQLGVALTRLLSGGGAVDAIDTLATMIFKRARTEKVKLSAIGAQDMATAVLAWHRHGTCQPCGGRGSLLMPGTPVNGELCPHCKGTGKIDFDANFHPALRRLAQWASDEIDCNIAFAAQEAMRRIAPRLEL